MQGRRQSLWLVAALAAQAAVGLRAAPARGEVAAAPPDVAALLAPGNPGEIQVVTVVPIPQIEGHQAVLYRWLGDQRWELEQRRAKTLDHALDALDALEERCDEESSGNESALTDCIAHGAPDPFVGWKRAGSPMASWKVAVVEPGSKTKAVVAQRELWHLSTLSAGGAAEPELRSTDLDRDGRPELTVTFPFEPPGNDYIFRQFGSATFILELPGLREQFATIRYHEEGGADVAGNTMRKTLLYRASDENNDGRSDLIVRGNWEDSRYDATGGEYGGNWTKSGLVAPITCIYDTKTDAWPCPGADAGYPTRPGGWDDVWADGEPDAPSPGPAPAPPATAKAAPTPPAATPAPAKASTPRCRRVVYDPESPLNVRAGPGSREAVVTSLTDGTELQGTERRGRWLHVTAPVDGWVWEANTREVCGP